jgi:hypothetical protein
LPQFFSDGGRRRRERRGLGAAPRKVITKVLEWLADYRSEHSALN